MPVSDAVRAAFFFGSGISYASGGPNVGQITDLVLNGAWWAHTDGRYYRQPADREQISTGDAVLAQEFLRRVYEYLAPRLETREKRVPNYEDLYGVSHQIVLNETSALGNPLVFDSVAAIKEATKPNWPGASFISSDNPFAAGAERTMDLIQASVLSALGNVTKPVGLSALGEVLRSVADVDLFSLNHDLLPESVAAEVGVPLIDGFGEKQGSIRIFNNQWHRDRAVARIVKLHGSINWYLIRFAKWDQFAVVNGNPDYCRDEDGNLLDPLSLFPRFLTGTHVKEEAYGLDIFGELFSEFRSLLSRHRTLICCGYGWGDKGINIRLRQWLRDAPENRIVILHGGERERVTNTGMWWAWWHDYEKAGKVVLIPKWLSDCSFADLEPYFDRVNG